jgi:hypothetical protein
MCSFGNIVGKNAYATIYIPTYLHQGYVQTYGTILDRWNLVGKIRGRNIGDPDKTIPSDFPAYGTVGTWYR